VTATAAVTDRSRAPKRRQLLVLRGKVQWQGDLDILRNNRMQFYEARNHKHVLNGKALD
jgi:hypothetical protein